jgi:hypothetical protein
MPKAARGFSDLRAATSPAGKNGGACGGDGARKRRKAEVQIMLKSRKSNRPKAAGQPARKTARKSAKSAKPRRPTPKAGRRRGSKQARVIGLLQRPEGATIEEIASAMGWQRHTVRGLLSGALKKKLGLQIVSEKTDRGRFYRIGESRSAAR